MSDPTTPSAQAVWVETMDVGAMVIPMIICQALRDMNLPTHDGMTTKTFDLLLAGLSADKSTTQTIQTFMDTHPSAKIYARQLFDELNRYEATP